jgi:hypothetical protein
MAHLHITYSPLLMQIAIRELSQGTFTKDNQLPLKTTRVDTDVFRAWVLGDVRLVYYIDCIDNPDSEVSYP